MFLQLDRPDVSDEHLHLQGFLGRGWWHHLFFLYHVSECNPKKYSVLTCPEFISSFGSFPFFILPNVPNANGDLNIR